MTFKSVIIGLALLGLTACASQQEADAAKCTSFGFAAGTDAFAHCMMQQDEERKAASQRTWDELLAVWAASASQPSTYQLPAQCNGFTRNC